MRFCLLIIFFLFLSCNKPRTVLICGDHICINKLEAEQYFEENLSIEVKILRKREKKEIDLVKLNLSENSSGEKKIRLSSIDKTNKDIKTLSQEEIIKIKKKLQNKKDKKEILKNDINDKKLVKKTTKENKKIEKKKFKKNQPAETIIKNNVSKNYKNIVDVCTIIEKCSIDEISKYLLKQGKNKDFPDITKRQ